jgi:hypothetical protein
VPLAVEEEVTTVMTVTTVATSLEKKRRTMM